MRCFSPDERGHRRMRSSTRTSTRFVSVLVVSFMLIAATQALSTSSSSSTPASSASNDVKPILVVGATGKVGRKVVQKLLGMNRPVRALVRNPQKAAEIFGTRSSLEYPPLEVVVADLGRYEDYEDVLDCAVEGCSAVVSVSGAIRFAKLSDFLLPWRLFQTDVSSWADRDHPYFANYLAQKKLLELAQKHRVGRFVRLTGLGLAYSAFVPFAILFNSLLSFTNRYGMLCEQALAEQSGNCVVPYVILRPGGLAEDERTTQTVNVQVEPTGKLPYPGRIGRSDVAELAVQACMVLPTEGKAAQSYTLASRWCGEDVKPKPQGTKEDGFPTARECLEELVSSGAVSPPPPRKMKPYAVAVSLVAYPILFLTGKFVWWLATLALGLVMGR
jgi:NAD(P)-dependent dehydrogenase (short-subunit alcohol dehydrogenase family)